MIDAALTRHSSGMIDPLGAVLRTLVYRQACEALSPAAEHREVIAKCERALFWLGLAETVVRRPSRRTPGASGRTCP